MLSTMYNLYVFKGGLFQVKRNKLFYQSKLLLYFSLAMSLNI